MLLKMRNIGASIVCITILMGLVSACSQQDLGFNQSEVNQGGSSEGPIGEYPLSPGDAAKNPHYISIIEVVAKDDPGLVLSNLPKDKTLDVIVNLKQRGPNGTLTNVKTVNAEFELHGATSMAFPKKSFKLNFKKNVTLPLFKGEDKKVDKIVYNASYIDPSFLRNWLVMKTIRALGGLAPRVHFGEALINGKKGFYQVIEHLDSWLERDENKDTGFYSGSGQVGIVKAVNHLNWRSAARNEGTTWALKEKFAKKIGYTNPQPIDVRLEVAELGHFYAEPANKDDVVLVSKATEKAFYDIKNGYIQLMGNVCNIPNFSWEKKLDTRDFYIFQMVHTYFVNWDTFDKNFFLLHGDKSEKWRIFNWDADTVLGLGWEGKMLDFADDDSMVPFDLFGPLGKTEDSCGNQFIVADREAEYKGYYHYQIDSGVLKNSVLKDYLGRMKALIKTYADSDLIVWPRDKTKGGEIEYNGSGLDQFEQAYARLVVELDKRNWRPNSGKPRHIKDEIINAVPVEKPVFK